MSRDPDLYEKLTASIAPSIWQMDDVKRGILCQLFGACSKVHNGCCASHLPGLLMQAVDAFADIQEQPFSIACHHTSHCRAERCFASIVCLASYRLAVSLQHAQYVHGHACRLLLFLLAISACTACCTYFQSHVGVQSRGAHCLSFGQLLRPLSMSILPSAASYLSDSRTICRTFPGGASEGS